ncbi:MAG: fibronectin type III domain-containing protein [Bacteroidota bacterium]|nr:fibronectin type III domain-containing protein [Bacteroidota bacterium]
MKQCFVLAVILGFLFTFAVFAQQLEIHHINVGQADATLIKSPTGITVLIDGGNTGNGTNIIRPYLTSLGITYLNYVICSHYHADHIGGLDEVINGMGASNIGAVYDRGRDAPLPTTVAFTDYEIAANSTGRRYKVALGQVLDLGGGLTMKCVATDGEVLNFGVVPGATGSENDLSIGWLLNFNTFQYFTGGDLGGESTSYADNETPLAPQVGDVDAFKINHHGSQYSTNQTFVNTLQPEVGIIPVGTNTYGHPTQIVLDRLDVANCYIYQTATGSGGTIPSGAGVVANNHVILKTSGTSYTVTYGTTTHSYTGDGGSGDVTPPVISGVNASSITSTGATINWITDEASNSVVEYGLTTSYGSSSSNATMVTSHSITLTGLSASTIYHYRVKSTDAANNTATSVDYTFTTLSNDVTPPIISSVQVINLTTTGATINWTTDEASNSVVEYGLTTSYGSSTTDASMVTSHSVTLSGLSAGAVYHYRVKSTDAAGNTTTDVDHSFQTGAPYTYVASATTITSGSLSSGTYSNLATNNASYYVLNSTTTGTRITDWYGSVTIAQVPSSISKLTVTYDGKYSRTTTQTLHLYNWATSAWAQIDSRSVGTSDVTVTNVQVSPANYISTSGVIRLRVYGTGGTKNYTCSGDFMQFVVDAAGSVISKPGISGIENTPTTFALYQNYPNPFNPATTIKYQIPDAMNVTLNVYDMLGREVATLVNGFVDAGSHEVVWDAANYPSGVYVYKLTMGNHYEMKKMLLVK